MEPVDLILVGCGVMGTRHLRGYAELERVRPGTLRLRAVCDPREEAAAGAAAEAEARLGYRPAICPSAAEALRREPGVAAADVATLNTAHPEVVIPLLEAGLHVQVEKPLAVTVAPGQAIVAAARRCGRVLAVAENYRRDPMNRLLRHALGAGAIGRPRFAMHLGMSPGQRVVVTPWRHAWGQGGLALDVGVHFTDMLEYLLGEVESVFALGQRVRDLREWTDAAGASRQVPVECDDAYAALLTFRGGAQGVWVMHFGSAGERQWQRSVHGERGALFGPPDRSGAPVRLERGGEALEGEALLAALPEFRLGETEARFFGERPARYERPFAEIDAQLIAVETADFLDAAREGREPEVTGEVGLRAVAVVMALLESAHAGQPVRVQDVLDGRARAFQERIERGG